MAHTSMRLKLANLLSTAATAYIVLAVGTVLSAAAAYFMARQTEQDASLKFERVVAEAQEAIETRIRAYSDVLLGVRALFLASDSVRRDEFQTYIASLDLNRRYPGIQVIHYAQRVPAAQRRAFEEMVRNDRSVDPRGYPDFAAKPPGNRLEYFIVQYVEPMAGNEVALGLDLGGDAVRLAALERTRDSGQLAASGTIALALDPKRHPGFAMRLPVYRKGMPVATVEQRREAFTGMVSTSFVVIDLMRGVLSEQSLQTVHVRIHDAGFLNGPRGLQQPSAENLMFDSDRLLPAGSRRDILSGSKLANLTSTAGLEVGGRRWNLHFSAREGFIAPSERLLPWATFLGGAVISLLLFGMIRSLATSGRRAIYLAERITQDLRKSEAQFQATFDQAAVGIAHFDLQHRNIKANRRYGEIVGYAPDELLGKPPGFLNHPDDVGMGSEQRSQLLTGAIDHFSQDKRYLRKDGTVIWVRRTESLARDGAGAPQYFIRVIEDITERKEAEAERARLAAIVQSSDDAIVSRDLDYRVTSWNTAAERMFDYTAEEVIGRNISSIIPHDRSADAAEKHALLEQDRPVPPYDTVHVTKDGRRVDISITRSPIKDHSGNMIGVSLMFRDISERKRAEAERAQLAAIVENSNDAIIGRSLDGTITSWNAGAQRIFGYSENEMIGQPITILVPEWHRHLTDNNERLRRGDTIPASERVRVTKDGRIINVLSSISPIKNEAGEVVGAAVIVRDISESKQAEERYRATFDNAPVGIMHTAIDDDRILTANAKLCEMLGYECDELVRMTTDQFIHPDYVGADQPKYRETMLKGEMDTFSSERLYRRKDGSDLWVNRTVSLARDAAGKPLYFIRMIEDIGERKRAEEAVASERALLRTIIDTVPDYIYVKDAQGRFQLANKAWLNERNTDAAEIVGKTVFDVFSPPDLARKMAEQDAAIVNGGAAMLEREQLVTVKAPDGKQGRTRWASITKVPMREPSGKIIGTVGISRDITEHKLSARRREMEHAVTKVLAESATVDEAMPKLIRTMCEAMGWAYGARWAWDEEEQRLCRAEYWCEFEPDFDPADREHWLKVADDGTGRMLRRVWQNKESTWLANLHDDKPFRRRPSAAKFGWHSAYAFPILAGSALIGVMEFFGREVREPDEMLLQITTSIGSQIGQFMARKQAEERVRHLAHYDELTGLPNRTMFNERLSHALAHARRTDRSLAILFIDLDRFKNINDTLGHEAGDRVLKEVADRLRGCLRESDTVGRLGGDEFVVLIEEPPRPVNAAVVAQKILAAMGKPFLVQAQEFHITASIGISSYPDDGADIQTLMKNADIAMYRAKEQGKNNFQFYSAQINVHSIERLTLESSLRRALERNEFLLHYQPKLDIGSGRITGVEALLRWQQPQGLIPPAQFIQLAEETGLIVPIGEWVLKTACAQNKAWQQQGWAPVRVAVNLSPRQFAHENLLQDVARVLKETGLDPDFLELEITESVVMHNPEQAVILLNRLKAFGIHLSIDDFGTGYSSLNYLKRLPIDRLKIDRTFIRDLPGDSDDAAITQAIIAMAHSLRLTVVAEGVETAEQLSFLRDYKCDEIQGYYFCRPQPENHIAPLLRDNATAGKVHSLP